MDINSLEQSMMLQRLLEPLPDPVEQGSDFIAWLSKNLDSFWQIIGSEKVDLNYVRYARRWSGDVRLAGEFWPADGVFFNISLDSFGCCNVRQAIVPIAVDAKTEEVSFGSNPESWSYSNANFGPSYFFWRVYDIMDKVHRHVDKFKLVNHGRFKTQLGTLLEIIIK